MRIGKKKPTYEPFPVSKAGDKVTVTLDEHAIKLLLDPLLHIAPYYETHEYFEKTFGWPEELPDEVFDDLTLARHIARFDGEPKPGFTQVFLVGRSEQEVMLQMTPDVFRMIAKALDLVVKETDKYEYWTIFQVERSEAVALNGRMQATLPLLG